MPRFFYKCRDREGKHVEGSLEAETPEMLAVGLKEKGLYPVHMSEAPPSNGFFSYPLQVFDRPGLKDVAVFSQQLYSLLASGLTVLDSLKILERQATSRKIKTVIHQTVDDIKKGNALSEAFGKHPNVFPNLFVNMVKSGEASGKIDSVMKRIADHYEKQNTFMEKIKSAMVYPILLSVVSVLVILFLATNVLPTFAGIYGEAGARLPAITRMVMGLGLFIKNHLLHLTAALVITALAAIKAAESYKGKTLFKKIIFKVPLFGSFYHKTIIAEFAQTLSILVGSGIPLDRALSVARVTLENGLFFNDINAIQTSVKKGQPVADSLKQTILFSPLFYQMAAIGEETGAFDVMLERLADFYKKEIDYTLDRMTRIIEPVIIIVMAVIVAAIVISIALPMFDILHIYN